MDAQPITVEPDATALEVARGMMNRSKSACLITDQSGAVYGIITPRELLPLIAKPVSEAELPVYIVGLTDEDFFERGVAEEKLRRVVTRNMRIHPGINEVSIKIKRQQNKGERTRYEVTARVISPNEQFNATTQGWDLLAAFDGLLENLDSTLKRAQRKPLKTARRGRGRG
jgi:ribosome-associated translation inhibitor RaiA